MKLYYSPGACSLSPHIVLLEAGLPFTSEKVDLKSKKTAAGVDFLTVNSKGSVPTLQLDDGQVLTEGPAIVQYLADLKPDSGLAPRAGTFERYRLMESSELHLLRTAQELRPAVQSGQHGGCEEGGTGYSRARNSTGCPAISAPRISWWAIGSRCADTYLFTVLGWSGHVGLDLQKWPVLAAYHARIGHRPKVQEALKAEGLIK